MKRGFLLILPIVVVTILNSCGSATKNDSKKEAVNVRTATVSSVRAGTEQSYSGTIVPQSETPLSFSAAGTIKSLNFKQGQMVSAGQVLGTIDVTTRANTLNASKAGTENAKAQLAKAQDAYDRMKILHDENALAEQKWVSIQEDLKRAKAAVKQAESMEAVSQKGLSDTRLVAPYSGYISAKNAEVGQNAMPGVPVARMVKINNVKARISVPEEEIGKIKIGTEVHLRVAALDNEMFEGVIKEKSVAADNISHSYEVMVEIQNGDRKLLPGMICEVFIGKEEKSETVLLPAEVVQLSYDNRNFVWTVKNGKAQQTFVQLGNNVGDMVEIVRGVSPGTKVIMQGQQKVSTGMEIKEQGSVWAK